MTEIIAGSGAAVLADLYTREMIGFIIFMLVWVSLSYAWYRLVCRAAS